MELICRVKVISSKKNHTESSEFKMCRKRWCVVLPKCSETGYPEWSESYSGDIFGFKVENCNCEQIQTGLCAHFSNYLRKTIEI